MPTVRDAVLDALRLHGMNTLFGNPGSTEIPFLADLPSDFSYILGLNEVVAASMADGHARATGRPTLVSLHSTVGLGNAMGALVNAQHAHSPVVALVGQQTRALVHSRAVLTNEHPHVLPLGTVKFAAEPVRAARVPAVLSQAIHLARLSPAGPVCVSVPMDDWHRECDPLDIRYTLPRHVFADSVLNPSAFARLLDRVRAARNPALVVGPALDTEEGYRHTTALAERLGAPVWIDWLPDRCGFPTGHPAFRGTLGPDAPSTAALFTGHDLVVALGCRVFRYFADAPAPHLPAGTELVSVTADPQDAATAVVGDCYLGAPAAAAELLASALPATARAAPGRRVLPPAYTDAAPRLLTADEVFTTLAEVVPPESVIVNEAYRQQEHFWARVPVERPGGYHLAGAGGLGFGMAGAVGVQLAQPRRPVIAILGDGAIQYTVQALWSAVHHRAPVTVVVLNNGQYAILHDVETRVGAGPVPGLRLPGLDPIAIARGYGVTATRVHTTRELRAALTSAVESPEPHLIDVAFVDDPTPDPPRRTGG
ncbi:benzoylformate decarboxylase [Embleya sp. NPDC056575]|uniref:benzoylformate decarboxylase n=1 Tax=unclassified Embleya TaxID=2699296 RepID=UPI0036A3729A